MDVSEESTPARRQVVRALGSKTGRRRCKQHKERQAWRLAHHFFSVDLFRTNLVQRNPGSNSSAKKVSTVRKKWEKLTNFFLARLMSIFGDLKSLRVLDAGRLCAIPLL